MPAILRPRTSWQIKAMPGTSECDTEAAFLDLNVSIHNDTVSAKIYDKRDDFEYTSVNSPLFDGDVPRRPSCYVYLNLFALPEHIRILQTSIVVTNS